MKKLTLPAIPVILILVFVCLLSTMAQPQRPNYPAAPKPLDNTAAPPSAGNNQRPIDLIQLQREADALAQTAQTIPGDVASVRKGILPKDVIQKLKQIEKLSKHLRSELNP